MGSVVQTLLMIVVICLHVQIGTTEMVRTLRYGCSSINRVVAAGDRAQRKEVGLPFPANWSASGLKVKDQSETHGANTYFLSDDVCVITLKWTLNAAKLPASMLFAYTCT